MNAPQSGPALREPGAPAPRTLTPSEHPAPIGGPPEDDRGHPVVGGIVVTPQVRALARKRFIFLNATHTLIDVYPIFFVSLIVMLTPRLHLTGWQVAAVFAITPIFSGSLQPFFAWFTDRFDTRVCAPLGMFLGATCIGSIGFAQNFWQLVALQVVGVVGTGMWHPVAAALAGQIGGRAFPSGRGIGLAVFFAAGMIGQSAGSWAAPWISKKWGMEHLAWLVIPGVIGAVALHRVLKHVPHRHDDHASRHSRVSREESRERWRAVITIAVANCLLYTVNIGVFAMLSVWAESKIADPNDAARLHGALVAFATVGMGLAGLFATRVVPVGREKVPVVAFCVAGAVCVGLFGVVGDLGLRLAGDAPWRFVPAYAWAILTAVGYFATIPVSMSVGQRLLPGRTGLVSSLLMGVGWAFSSVAPFIAPLFLGGVSLKAADSLPASQINLGFAGFGLIALGAGAIYMTVNRRVVASAARD